MQRGMVDLLASWLLLSSLAAWPQNTSKLSQGNSFISVRPADRIVRRIDDEQRVVLSGYRHPLAKAGYAVGNLPKNQSMERMILVLRPDPAQGKALEGLIAAQQDPNSPYYHQWLTPASFGERFGISQRDLDQVVSWLEMHGMRVEEIPPSRRAIVFSGSVAQVESTFHTSIQKYLVKGESHFANATDPEIPQAFAEVVHGVVSLHDFRSAPQLAGPYAAPAFTNSYGAHFLSPKDWDTIYDVGPLYGQGLDGSGQSIAVLGRVDVALQDVRAFRTNSGLPAKDPQMIVNGPDPGFPNCNDEVEAALDVEWAGAIAKNATVKFVTSKSAATDGINLSAQYAVTHNVAPIVTLSYGLCEAAYSPAGNAFWNGLWAQAAAQGMSVFVSSGDSGAAGCDSPSLKTATHGRGVNALCSSPYSTCVGGTQFNDDYNPEFYWSATNGSGMSSALSYIPEIAWNESGWSGGLWSTGGGASSVYSKPTWQVAPGVPADGKRDVPDVSMSGAIHDAYVIQIQNQTFYVAGTSAATPSLASLMALVLKSAGAPQGNVNPNLYGLANLQLSGGGAAVFHDIASGNNSVPGVTGYTAAPGYDLATGLGSVDANLLVNHWKDLSARTFTLTPGATSAIVAAGTSTAIALTTAAQYGFNSTVALSIAGLPKGITASFAPTSIPSPGNGSSKLTLAAAVSTAAGTYNVTISAKGGGVTQTQRFSLTIVVPSFTLALGAAKANVTAGGSLPITISTVALNGFKSAVALSVSGLPRGVTASFAPSTIAAPSNGASKLTLKAASTTIANTYNLTVTGAGGGVTKTQRLSLTVLRAGSH